MKRKHEQNEGELCPARLHRVSIVCPMVAWMKASQKRKTSTPTTNKQMSNNKCEPTQFLVVFWACFAYGEHKLGSSLSVFQNNGGNIKGPVLPEEQLNFSMLQNCKLFKEKMHSNKLNNLWIHIMLFNIIFLVFFLIFFNEIHSHSSINNSLLFPLSLI